MSYDESLLQMAYLFDNKATVAYAAIITVWSALFLPAWDVAEYQYQVRPIRQWFHCKQVSHLFAV
jgi:hypothetical protein